jgi:1,2-diacylglycerol 3-beta-glucosyltransferase
VHKQEREPDVIWGADLAVCLVAAPIILACAYLLMLTVVSFWRLRTFLPPQPKLRFDLIVPAHNESANIETTVKNLFALDWPRELMRVVVVADNCTDDTAEKARAAGAVALERNHQSLRGKGHALAFAFAHLQGDAAVVIDADSTVSPNLLRAFSARIEQGAQACQAYYGVINPSASWRTTLMAIAFAMFHRVRGRAREFLNFSCGLKGNGMCFTRALLERVPHDAFGLVEDVEFGARLAVEAERVWYVDEAEVFGEMVTSEEASRSQRVRWEAGRRSIRAAVPQLLSAAWKMKTTMPLDLAVDLLIPPLAYLGIGVSVLSFVGAMLALAHAPGSALRLGLFCMACLVAYVLRGWRLSGTGARGLLMLFSSPLYVAWKVALMRREKAAPTEWVRTQREAERAAEEEA